MLAAQTLQRAELTLRLLMLLLELGKRLATPLLKLLQQLASSFAARLSATIQRLAEATELLAVELGLPLAASVVAVRAEQPRQFLSTLAQLTSCVSQHRWGPRWGRARRRLVGGGRWRPRLLYARCPLFTVRALAPETAELCPQLLLALLRTRCGVLCAAQQRCKCWQAFASAEALRKLSEQLRATLLLGPELCQQLFTAGVLL
mmetsp:Transcript_94450/g.267137  ORF Transcript_94450/g.267137 Transcript_94450/m.267137 type:complete len:204 (-) Transcript_94450:2252-2863(-)